MDNKNEKTVEQQIQESEFINSCKEIGGEYEEFARKVVNMPDSDRDILTVILGLKIVGNISLVESVVMNIALKKLQMKDKESFEVATAVILKVLNKLIEKEKGI